jgi:hypothetical protein
VAHVAKIPVVKVTLGKTRALQHGAPLLLQLKAFKADLIHLVFAG